MREIGGQERQELLSKIGRSYHAGDSVFREGDTAAHCFFVEEGRARLIRRIRDREHELRNLRAGDLFGEDFLLPVPVRCATAIAVTELTLLALDRSTLFALLRENPEVGVRLFEKMARRSREIEAQAEGITLQDPTSRVVYTLLALCSITPEKEEGLAIQLSPAELANRVGLNPEHVKKILGQLRDAGHIQITDHAIVAPKNFESLHTLFELLGAKEKISGEECE